ncbi:polyamine-transporting ATPase 13A3 isoform X2 [Sitodiplosis mosellana]|uniref:polyamine-transporting ATPase 13A3 isoform X2 n=1 Tax=Sitodiplosis mosellana TaxID=263140 RepID=UPI002443A77C|nr:polyamine-transporting ATPase 13A3 isoform X2 [Sitodiplosis mosellana]XP_055312780.1 polyamine-transporting ATPase 13A3 isoform X2 [Sitodiplosis mosellana]
MRKYLLNIIGNESKSSLPTSKTLPAKTTAVLNVGEDDEITITGYERSIVKTILTWIAFILSAGLIRLFMHWRRHWLLFATHRPCGLSVARKILIREYFEGKHTVHYVKDVINMDAEWFRKIRAKRSGKNEFMPFDEDDTDTDFDEKHFQLSIHLSGGIFRNIDSLRLFKCKQLRYIWDERSSEFVKLKGLDANVPATLLHQLKGLDVHTQRSRQLVYGSNQIFIPLKSVLTLLFLEVLNPYYVFQVFSVGLWFSYNYYYYAVVIILMSVFGITMSIIQTRKNQLALYKTVVSLETAVVVRADGKSQKIDTKYLVPGDILEIPSNGCTMQCDAVLLSGNCILDESMLTGESVPVTKTPLPCIRDLIFDTREHSRHVLFSGTKVIQTRYIGTEKVLACIINTGNITAKGGLIRSILYPPPVDYKFEQDSYKFIALLGLTAALGFIYTLVSKIQKGIPATKIAIESLDLITIAVPPALPAAMAVGSFYAQKRLEKNNIFCISPRSITVSGSIDCVCFDKTGTLTEDGLDMWGVVPTSSTNLFQIPLRDVERLPYDHLLYGMATCHSITIMNGELKGDPLDLKMFESTNWILEEANISDDTKYDLLFPTIVRPPKRNQLVDNSRGSSMDTINDLDQTQNRSSNSELNGDMDIGIVREFSFTSSLQRMAVVTRKLMDKNFNVYCKGSPEMIQTLCKPETIPNDFHTKLDVYAQQGYRIIAMAYKSLHKKVSYAKVQRLSREQIECDLTFLGFVILENRLKPDTIDIITNLMTANIRTIMVTGDNILTALSVAHDCDMIPTGQDVIIVTAKQKQLHSNDYELIYHLTGPSGNNNQLNAPALMSNTNGAPNNPLLPINLSAAHLQQLHNDQLKSKPNGFIANERNSNATMENGTADYMLMTNSNSIASLETVDTCTQTTQITLRDIEMGHDTQHKPHNQYEGYDDENNYMVPELPNNNYRFAMTGKTWTVIRDNFPELLPKFVTRGTVFARMSPDNKQALISELQELGYYVAMCGDGANDCGALKAAHTGISLSEAESSVASPFTSKNPTIACVPNVIKEGRCALVTSVAIFKYMAAYSLVQFASVLTLYTIDSNLTDIEFLYIDLFMISIFAFFFGKTEAYVGPLVKQTPLNSLISVSPIASLVLHLLLAISFQLMGWFYLKQQSWYTPFQYNETNENLGCYENYTIFIISCFQYIILAVVFSKGAPYRKSIFTNIGFLCSLAVNAIVTVVLAVFQWERFTAWLDLIYPPDPQFRITIVGIGLVNFLLSMFIEYYLVENLLFRRLRYRFHNVEKSRRKFLSIENQLRQMPSWPPISPMFGNDPNSGGGGDGLASTPTSPVATVTNSEEDHQSPKSFTEICVEADSMTLDNCNSVLKGFFDHLDSESDNGGHDDDDDDDVLSSDSESEVIQSNGTMPPRAMSETNVIDNSDKDDLRSPSLTSNGNATDLN